jgi:hypothetical protein
MTQPKGARWLDPRLAIGAAISVGAVWFALRNVELGEVVDDLAAADLWIAAPVSAACYFASLWLRVLRWRHLAAGIGTLPLGSAYRATAIRFMVNNLFPLRLGELVGPWVVSREVGGSAAVWFGTVVLERAFDMTAIMSLAIFLIAEYVDLGLFRVVAFVPMLGIVALRLWPAIFLRLGHRALNAALPAKLAPKATELLDQIVAGLAGIRDPRGLALVIVHTFLLWVVVSPIPFLCAQRALGVDLGSARTEFVGALMTMVAVAAAVGLPQAPGFVGVYQAACQTLLVLVFDVDESAALAVGTVAHALFWLFITGFGLLALRGTRSSLGDALRGASGG